MASLEADAAEAGEARRMIRALLELGYTVGAIYVQSLNVVIEKHPSFVPCPVPHAQQRSNSVVTAAIQSFAPDVGHVVASWNPFHVRVTDLLRKLRVPYMVEPGGGMAAICLDHRFGEKPTYFYHRIARRLYKRFYDLKMLQHAALIRAVSPFEARDLQSRFALDSQVLTLGYNPEWVTAARLRRGPATLPIRFLFVGRVEIFQKGLDLILDAVKILNTSGLASTFTVTIAGPEVNRSFTRIPNFLRQHGISNVSLHGPVYGDPKQNLFEQSDVFLHPSRCEQIAKMAREATAAALPVIAGEDSNYGELVRDHAIGVFTRLDAEDLARAMKLFIDHPEFVLTMGQAAVDFARTWSWQKVAQELLEMYQKILHISARPTIPTVAI